LPRFHLSVAPGYFSSQGIDDVKKVLREIGFVDNEFHQGGFFPTTPFSVTYPDVIKNPVIYIKEINAEFSISKHFALGISYSPIGLHKVSGRKVMPHMDWRNYIEEESFLYGEYSGNIYFLKGSFMPIPDAFLNKNAIKLGAGIGYGIVNVEFVTSIYKYSLDDHIDKKKLSFNPLSFVLFGEINHFFSKNWSIGINADYKYTQFHIDSFQLEAPYQYFKEYSGNLIFDSETIHIPSQRINAGGFGFGINFGVHF
jgi:hypothetical protein